MQTETTDPNPDNVSKFIEAESTAIIPLRDFWLWIGCIVAMDQLVYQGGAGLAHALLLGLLALVLSARRFSALSRYHWPVFAALITLLLSVLWQSKSTSLEVIFLLLFCLSLSINNFSCHVENAFGQSGIHSHWCFCLLV